MCYNQEFNQGKKVATSTQEDGRYCRMCTTCGDVFNDGFMYNGGSMYFCSEDCLHEEVSAEEWEEAHAEDDNENYYTEWDAESDAEYEVKNGIIYLLETNEIVFFDEEGQPHTDEPKIISESEQKITDVKIIKEEDAAIYTRTIKAVIVGLTEEQLTLFSIKVKIHNKLMLDGLYFNLNRNELTVVSSKKGLTVQEQTELLEDFIKNKAITYSFQPLNLKK